MNNADQVCQCHLCHSNPRVAILEWRAKTFESLARAQALINRATADIIDIEFAAKDMTVGRLHRINSDPEARASLEALESIGLGADVIRLLEGAHVAILRHSEPTNSPEESKCP